MAELKLTNSDQVVLVDAELLPELNKKRWFLRKSAYCTYPSTSIRTGDKVKTVRLHRYVWELLFGPLPPKNDVHHINADRFDCTLDNLEPIDHSEHGLLQGDK